MLQIAMAVMGIIVLFTGKLKLSANKVVVGVPARLLGVLLLAPLPVAFGIGVCIGLYVTATGGDIEKLQMPMLAVDVGIVLLTAIVVVVIANIIGKPPGQVTPAGFPPGYPNYLPPGTPPPNDPNNPYQSPFNP